MLTITELKESSLPVRFLNTLPEFCDTCGSPNEITETLTLLRCSNESCGSKTVQRMVAMLKDLGVKGMGESKCEAFLKFFQVNNPYIIFMYELSDGPLYENCSMDFSETIFDQVDAKRNMMLWEYVKIGNLPGIRNSALRLFGDYDDLHSFYEDLHDGGVPFVQNLLSIQGKGGDTDDEDEDDSSLGVSIRAVQVYNTLVAYENDLVQALEYVNIKSLEVPTLNICISRAVGGNYGSKQEFVSQMNNSFGDKVHLNFLESVSKDCAFLIWSKEGSPTSKVKKVGTMNAKMRAANIVAGRDPDYGMINILTGDEFKEYLESL